jgi:hypothetical protein
MDYGEYCRIFQFYNKHIANWLVYITEKCVINFRKKKFEIEFVTNSQVSRHDVRQAAGRKLPNLYHNMIKNMLYRSHLVG